MRDQKKMRVLRDFDYYHVRHENAVHASEKPKRKPLLSARRGRILYVARPREKPPEERLRLYVRGGRRMITITKRDLERLIEEGVLEYV